MGLEPKVRLSRLFSHPSGACSAARSITSSGMEMFVRVG